jgi:ketosteroid isomerase-like protein
MLIRTVSRPLATVLIAAWLIASVGCSGGDAPSPQANSKAPTGDKASDPISEAAYDFMDAVFANDIARATSRLTPQAIQNMEAQDKRFEWGAQAAKLQIGEVRVSGNEAAVQCLVTDRSDAGAEQEELLCVLRRIGDQWRVYGVAWEGNEGGDPQVVNFEESPNAPPAQQPPHPQGSDRYVEAPAPQIPAGQAAPATPARTAAQPPEGLVH